MTKAPIFIIIVNLIIASTILYYVFQLEKLSNCDCSQDWRRQYVKYYFVFIVLLMLVSLFTGIRIKNKAILVFLQVILLIQILALFTYIRKLQKECKCATELDLYLFAKYYSWLQMIILVFGVLMFAMLYLLRK